jgi:TonB family protein
MNYQCRCLLVLFICLTGCVITSAQAPGHQNLVFGPPREISEATLPCSPDEETWWKAVRKAGNSLRRGKGGKKEVAKFSELLNEGVAKSYKVPIADQRALRITSAEPQYTDEARSRNINGTVILRALVLPDGSVDQIRVLRGLGFGLDEKSIDAARGSIFLPGVKDGTFIKSFVQLEMNFNIYRIR